MSHFLLYVLKCALLLGVFDAFFLLVMRRSGWFRFNRIVLLAGSVLCLLLPLIPVQLPSPTLYSQWIEPVFVVAYSNSAPVVETSEAAAPEMPLWQNLVLAIYAAGALTTFAFYVRSYGSMFRLLRHTPGERHSGYTLHLLDREMPSFSWMRHIVIARSDYAHYPAILTHERAHVRCGHSVDLLLSSALTVLQWFNPLVWICRSELKLLHEYEADDFVLNQGIDATQYQLLLVKKAVGEKRFLLANGFNHAQLKNRITMMQTTTKAVWKKFSLLLLLPLLAAATLLLAECTSKETGDLTEPAVSEQAQPVVESPAAEAETQAEPADESEAIPFRLVETKPMFEGGDANNFARWVNQQLHYPPEAVQQRLQGRVTLQFTVEKDGSVTGVKVLRGVHPILNEEAVRVVSQSPKWTPGTVKGEPARVVYHFPLVFQLSK